MVTYMCLMQMDRKRMDVDLQTVMSVIPSVPLPPNRRSSQSSAASSSDSLGTSAAEADHSAPGWDSDLGQVEVRVEGEGVLKGNVNVSGPLYTGLSSPPGLSNVPPLLSILMCLAPYTLFHLSSCRCLCPESRPKSMLTCMK